MSRRSDFRETMIGSVLCGGALLHLWFHGAWGQEDWGVVAIIVIGAGIMFNREITDLIRAWRGDRP